MEIRFLNSLTRSLEPFEPLHPDTVGLYTCGPTVYNYAHIGNFRAYAFEDILRRTLEYAGYTVRHVMNLTDVDDKTIRGSRAAGVALRDYTATYKQVFFVPLFLGLLLHAVIPGVHFIRAVLIEQIEGGAGEFEEAGSGLFAQKEVEDGLPQFGRGNPRWHCRTLRARSFRLISAALHQRRRVPEGAEGGVCFSCGKHAETGVSRRADAFDKPPLQTYDKP